MMLTGSKDESSRVQEFPSKATKRARKRHEQIRREDKRKGWCQEATSAVHLVLLF